MKSPFFHLFLWGCIFLTLTPQEGQAQDKQPFDECLITSNAIVRLRPPSYGHARSWDVLYGGDGYDRFTDIAPLDAEKVILAGDYTKGEADGIYKPMLMLMDNRGRTQWEVREESETNKYIKRIVKTEKGVTALGEMTDSTRGRGIFISHYDDAGKKSGGKEIFEPGADLDAIAIIQTNSKDGFIIAAQYHNAKEEGDKYGLVYRIDNGGRQIWRRAYRPGIVTFFHNIHNLPDKAYLASGQIQLEDGRLAAWGLKLDERGAVEWQQIYPRGHQSTLRSGGVFADGGYVFVGDAEPLGGGRKSGWLMVTDNAGSVLWQRYYTGDFNYVAHDLIAYPDGRTDVLLSALSLEKQRTQPHVYLLTVSPQGHLVDAKAYVDGQGAGAKRLILMPDFYRLFVGAAQTIVPDDLEPGVFAPFTFDAWLVGAPSLDPFKDKCKQNPLDEIKPVKNDPF